MRRLMQSAGNRLLSMLRRLGFDAWPIRGRSLEVIGVKLAWGRDGPGSIRGTVYEHCIDGVDVRFFVSDENDWLQREHVAGQWYEPRELEYIAGAYRGGTFVDIGAGLGNHSLYAGLVLRAPRIIAFEPVPLTWKICSLNMLLNNLDPLATVHRLGLSDRDGPASIVETRELNIGATALGHDPQGALELAQGDRLLAGEAIGFLKIDVEGMEMAVLRGLSRVIAEQRPPMLIEVQPEHRPEIEGWADANGYRIAQEVRRTVESNLLLVPR